MSIRYKLFLLSLFIALVPLLFSAVFTFQKTKTTSIQGTLNRLESISFLQEERINETINGYLGVIDLVTSNEQLSLYTQQNDYPKIISTLKGLKKTNSIIESISILSQDGIVLASTNESLEGQDKSSEDFFLKGQVGSSLEDIFKDENNTLQIRLVGPLFLNDAPIGVVEIITGADPIMAVTEDQTGLGLTGEVLLAKRNSAGDALLLVPVRFDPDAALNRAVSKNDTNVAMTIALSGEESTLTDDDIIDYRGESVFAVTRYIDALDWGLVTKMDKSEVLQPVKDIQRVFILVILVSIGVIVLTVYIFSRAVTEPIHSLTVFAEGLQKGHFEKRINIRSKDEFAYLADTFNKMAQELQALYRNLEEKVRSRTNELDEAKAKDEAMLVSIGDGVAFINMKKNVVFLNEAAERILGWKKEELIGKNWFDFVRAKNEGQKKAPVEHLPLAKVLSSKKPLVSSDDSHYYTRKTSETFPVAITASSVSLKNKKLGVIVVFRDITHEKEVDKAKTEFVSLASHQLRTPLTSISWYAEMLLAEDAGHLNKTQKDYLENIYVSNQHMIELVNSLLNVSRLELGTIIVEPTKTDIILLAKSVISEQKSQSTERKIAVAPYFAAKIPSISIDPKLLRMVLQNLLSNAIKYTPEGGRVEFEVAHKKADKLIYFRVSDTGLGIPESQKKNIFTKLFRADNVKASDTEGTGLGLYIVKAVVERFGGKIWFESEEGKGSSFYITFPDAGIKAKKGTRHIE